MPPNRTWTLPIEVATFPFWSRVRKAGLAGPMFVPVRVTISPGETEPLCRLAAFSKATITGKGGAATVITEESAYKLNSPVLGLKLQLAHKELVCALHPCVTSLRESPP